MTLNPNELPGYKTIYGNDEVRQAIANAEVAQKLGTNGVNTSVNSSTTQFSDGTEITGTTIPPGGVGIRGWLSATYKLFNDRFPLSLINDRLKVDVNFPARQQVEVRNTTLTLASDSNPIPIKQGVGELFSVSLNPGSNRVGTVFFNESYPIVQVQVITVNIPAGQTPNTWFALNNASGTDLTTNQAVKRILLTPEIITATSGAANLEIRARWSDGSNQHSRYEVLESFSTSTGGFVNVNQAIKIWTIANTNVLGSRPETPIELVGKGRYLYLEARLTASAVSAGVVRFNTHTYY